MTEKPMSETGSV